MMRHVDTAPWFTLGLFITGVLHMHKMAGGWNLWYLVLYMVSPIILIGFCLYIGMRVVGHYEYRERQRRE
jgi:hypothetical protein